MSDEFTARNDTMETVLKQFADITFNKTSSGTYTRAQVLQLKKSYTTILGGTHSRAQSYLPDQPNLQALMLPTSNKLTDAKQNNSVTPASLIAANKKLIEEKTAEAKANKDASVIIIIPNKLTKDEASLYSEEYNCSNQSALGAKGAVIKDVEDKFGKEIVGPFIMDADGTDRRSIDEYKLDDLFTFLLDAADRATFAEQRTKMITILNSQIDFQKKMGMNANTIKSKLHVLKDHGIFMDPSNMFVVIMAEVEAVLTEPWARHYTQIFEDIKTTYPATYKHTKESLEKVVTTLGTADTKRNLQDAPAPEETAHAVLSKEDAETLSLAYSVLASKGANFGIHDDYSTTSEEEEANAVQEKPRGRSSSRRPPVKSDRSKSRVRVSDEQKEKNLKCPHCNKQNKRNQL